MAEDNILNHQNKMFIIDRYKKPSIKYFIQIIVNILLDFIFKLVFYIFGPKKIVPKKYFISICGIFKNEAPFMQEWIEYHLLLGVEHFYLYNNNSDDNFNHILEPYINKGIVTLIDWPIVPGQLAAYQHFYNNYRSETNWVSFLDLDEYICPLETNTIKEWLNKFSCYPVIMVYWKMFGTNSQLKHDYTSLITEQYINSWPKLDSIGKLLYNTDYDIEKFERGMMHYFKVKYMHLSIPPINQFGYFVNYDIHRYNRKIDIQCNHYWSKSYKCYEAKHSKGSAAFGKSWKTFDKFLLHEMHNTSCDYSIRRFLIQLKLNLNKMNNK